MLQQILAALPPELVVTLVTAFLSGASTLLGLMFNELRKRFKGESENVWIGRLEKAALSVVASVEERIVADLKANNSGALSARDIAQVRELAFIALKDELGKAGLTAIEKITGDTDRVLRDKLDAALHKLRKGEASW